MKTAEERFWGKVEKTSNCWKWTACKIRGYGYFRLDGKSVQVHRFSYTMTHGSIPQGMFVDHICHNHSCVNPAHLRLATPAENSQYRNGPESGNQSGHRGVSWYKPTHKWRVTVTSYGKRHHGGYFVNLEEAASAARQLRNKLHAFEATK